VKSAGYGHTVRKTIFSAYPPTELVDDGAFQVEVEDAPYPAFRHEGALYDPGGERVRA
jgi:hypothetical protein